MMKLSTHITFLFVTLISAASATDFPDKNSAAWQRLFAVDPVSSRLEVLPVSKPANAITYDVTLKGEIAGFDVGRVFLNTQSGPKGYAVDYRMEQRGIARWFSDAEARSHARGTFRDGEIDGHYYFNHDYERDDDQQYVQLYRAPQGRRIRLWTEPAYDFYEPVPEELALGAVDPMAALIALGFLDEGDGKSPCDRTVEVFDGRRRFDLVMFDDGTEDVRKGGKGRFSGFTHKCKLTQVKVAGYREKDKGDIDGDLWVYLAPVPGAVRTKTFSYVPVMIVAKRGIISARLEGKYPTITMPSGRKIEMWD